MSKILSIIIPFYNAEAYINELLECLNPQITDDVEVILVDDGSKVRFKTDYKWCNVVRQKNKGLAGARNTGIEHSCGEYISFIDADDLVAKDFVEQVIDTIKREKFNVCELSWKSLPGGTQFDYKLRTPNDHLTNPSACTRIFKRSFIGDARFNEKKRATEDEDFSRKLAYIGIKDKSIISDYMYFYRTTTPESLSKRYIAGELDVKRIIYYFRVVTKDMTYLIDEIKKMDEENEVFLMTQDNQIPELARWCQIVRPHKMTAHEARGELNNYIQVMPKPLKTQVVIFTSQTFEIGGIETFIYNFVKQMSKYYDITVLYNNIATNQMARLAEICPVVKNDPQKPISCDTIIVNRIADKIPPNVTYKKSIQMVHCMKQGYDWHVPQDKDFIVNVSEASKESFGKETENATVIHNITTSDRVQKALLLVSAMRVGADDKQGNDVRCIEFARMLNRYQIPFIWLYFGDKPMKDAAEGMIYCGSKIDIKPYIAMADYLVQLSGSEAFCYSIVEALEAHTAVIATPLKVLPEIGFEDGKTGYTLDFDVNEWTEDDITRLTEIPKFEYKQDNKAIIAKWRELLGKSKPTHDYQPKKEVEVEVMMEYKDIQLNKLMHPGFRCTMKYARALDLQSVGFVRIL